MNKPSRKPLLVWTGALLVAAAALLVAQGVTAQGGGKAAAPHPGKYTCYQVFIHPSSLPSYTHMGYVTLLPQNKYQYRQQADKRGNYAFGPGDVVRFVDGPLKGVGAKFETKKSGRHLLELTFRLDDGKQAKQYCNCQEHEKTK